MYRIIYLSVFFTVCLFFSFSLNAQVISQFDWDSNPLTRATVGPDASSVSNSAISDAGGATANGLNPSLPKADINFIIPGSPTFDVDNIEVQFDYQREESAAYFFERGSHIQIGMSGGRISIFYRVDDGAGGFLEVSGSNIYTIPNDDTYRTYKLTYDSDTGVGTFTVDEVQVWSNNGPDGRNLYWTGAGDVMIGRLLDGSGTNKTCLDNFKISAPQSASLPIELTFFKVSPQNNYAKIEWGTATETNNKFFTIERSTDGKKWNELTKISGVGNSDENVSYSTMDEEPMLGISYYRLKQTDFDGTFTYSETRSLKMELGAEIKVFPNPVVSELNIKTENTEEYTVRIFNQAGQAVPVTVDNSGYEIRMDLASLQPGFYTLQIIDGRRQITTKRIVKK